MFSLLVHVLHFMVGTKLIRDCRTIGSATTRGLSCVFNAMIIIGCNLSAKRGEEGIEARVGSVCSAEDTIRRREEAHHRMLREWKFET